MFLIDTMWLLFILTGATLIGIRFLSYCQISWSGNLEHLLISSSVGLIIYSVSMTVIGWLVGFYSWIAYILIFSSLILIRTYFNTLRIFFQSIHLSTPSLTNMGLLLILIILVGINYSVAVAPLMGGSGSDDVTYQVGVPKVYAAYHGFEVLPENARSFLPQNINMLYIIGVLSGGNEVAKLINFMFGLGILGITYHIARRYIHHNMALLAATICYSNPLFSHNSSLAYIGLGMTMYLTLGVYALIQWQETDNRKWLMLAALFFGFNIGSQYFGLIYLAAATPILLLNWRRLSIKSILLFGGIIFLVASPWYIKNWFLTGNPVYPVFPEWITNEALLDLVQKTPLTGENSYTNNPTLAGLLTIPWHLLVHGNWFFFWGGMGHLFFLFIPLFILFHEKQTTSAYWYLLLTAILIGVLWYATKSNGVRYLVSVVPLLSIVTVAAIKGCMTHRITSWVTIGTLSLGLMYGVMAGVKENSNGMKYLIQNLSKEAYLRSSISYYTGCEYLNQLPTETTKVFITGAIFPVFLDVPSVGPHRKAYSPFTEGLDNSSWLRTPLSEFKKMGITHVMDDKTGQFLEVRQIQKDADSFKQVFAQNNIKVYAVSY